MLIRSIRALRADRFWRWPPSAIHTSDWLVYQSSLPFIPSLFLPCSSLHWSWSFWRQRWRRQWLHRNSKRCLTPCWTSRRPISSTTVPRRWRSRIVCDPSRTLIFWAHCMPTIRPSRICFGHIRCASAGMRMSRSWVVRDGPSSFGRCSCTSSRRFGSRRSGTGMPRGVTIWTVCSGCSTLQSNPIESSVHPANPVWFGLLQGPLALSHLATFDAS